MPEQIIEVLFVVLKVFRAIMQRSVPRIIVFSDLVHHLGNSLRMIPYNQIVLILELTVKGRRGIAAVFRDIPDGDFIDILFLGKLTEGLRKDFFCCFAFHMITFICSLIILKLYQNDSVLSIKKLRTVMFPSGDFITSFYYCQRATEGCVVFTDQTLPSSLPVSFCSSFAFFEDQRNEVCDISPREKYAEIFEDHQPPSLM